MNRGADQITGRGEHSSQSCPLYKILVNVRVYVGDLPLQSRRSRTRDQTSEHTLSGRGNACQLTIPIVRKYSSKYACLYVSLETIWLPLFRTLTDPRLASISATPGSMARAVRLFRTVADGEAVAVPTARAPRSSVCTHLRWNRKTKVRDV